ncbi:MAG TPA: hypothetical protein PL051_03465 [Candidatus Saccharibacteria bacterium]|nr:hypothetical protein [Candidatus Saccharibacteria bacterium]
MSDEKTLLPIDRALMMSTLLLESGVMMHHAERGVIAKELAELREAIRTSNSALYISTRLVDLELALQQLPTAVQAHFRRVLEPLHMVLGTTHARI